METILRYVIIAAVGALASILANQSIAVFNDGLRPVLPEYLEKRMDRKALAATSFAIGFGLVIGYGLPTSIAASIILIHCILLTTDIIGTWCPYTKKVCSSGCIGCHKCEKTCPQGAITVDNFLARIDWNKCTACGACASVCPTGAMVYGDFSGASRVQPLKKNCGAS